MTLGFLIAGLAGWQYGFKVMVGISVLQIPFFTIRHKSLIQFSVQVRIAYAAIACAALFDPTTIVFWMLLVGTFMVTFFDRCIIARVLIFAPWNKGLSLKI